ncbi:MAG: sporulation protein YunB [Eubacteriales bacterium]|nr:sporulation protein YunB [Eubacteriales bacterium]
MACRKKEPQPQSRWRKALRALLILALLLAALFLVLEKNLEEVILEMARARAEAMAVEYINEAVEDSTGGQASYSDMITVRTDSQGRVTMLEANAARMNQLAAQTALRAQARLESAEAQSVSIPLGAALGVPFLSALGPYVHVRIVPVSAVSAVFSTEFESAGINQTRHKIYLSLQTTVRLVIPSGAKQVALGSQVLVAESIIVGEVPSSYVNVPEVGDALNFALP